MKPKQTKRVRGTKVRNSAPVKPYLKTTENKGLYAPPDELETASEAPVTSSINQGFSFLNGFGGIDGMISMMGKAQQMFRLFQQMGPMFKMFDAFGGAKAVTASLRRSRMHLQPARSKAYSRKKLSKRS
jgi:hypothetical protein